jgi:trimeric autotransporter adhesin
MNSSKIETGHSVIRSSVRRMLILVPLALICFAVSQVAQAGPDDEYPNYNTAEGLGALYQITTNHATGADNTAIGVSALYNNTTGTQNVATGYFALSFGNTAGSYNTATGTYALADNNADYNTATGYHALYGNITGSYNTATGAYALSSNYGNYYNTAFGFGALYSNTADGNTATGYEALYNNTTGTQNVATGVGALYSNQSGSYNTATGLGTLHQNTQGSNNTANGINVLYHNSGSMNTAYGANTLETNTSGNNNTATGYDALLYNTTGHDNTAAGYNALLHVAGSNNVALGSSAGSNLTTGSNNIDIGNAGVAGESGRIRIGTAGKQTDTLIAGIYGKTIASGVQVIIGSGGKLGTIQSSARYKDDIRPMDKSSEAILALKPVTFRYKEELDPDKIPQFGLVAEAVEKVNPDLVIRGEDGNVMSVRYEAVNAMLLNEFLKEHRKVQEQQATIACLKNEFESKFAQQQKQIEALTNSVRKVSERVALSAPAPQTVANNQ